jgi:TPR repeat protein
MPFSRAELGVLASVPRRSQARDVAEINIGSALAEGFFWMGEKLRYGYEDMPVDPEQALKLYRQAADLGYARAFIRIGELYERGIGTSADPRQAFKAYIKASEHGDLVGFSALARLVSRSKQRDKADALWAKFFHGLASAKTVDLGLDEPAASIHSYLFGSWRDRKSPDYFPS